MISTKNSRLPTSMLPTPFSSKSQIGLLKCSRSLASLFQNYHLDWAGQKTVTHSFPNSKKECDIEMQYEPKPSPNQELTRLIISHSNLIQSYRLRILPLLLIVEESKISQTLFRKPLLQ